MFWTPSDQFLRLCAPLGQLYISIALLSVRKLPVHFNFQSRTQNVQFPCDNFISAFGKSSFFLFLAGNFIEQWHEDDAVLERLLGFDVLSCQINLDLPTSFVKTVIFGHVLMVRKFHLFSILVMKMQVSLCIWSKKMLSHQFVFGISPRANCFRKHLEHSSVDSLENIRFLILKRITNCFQQLFPLLSFHRYSPNLKRFAHPRVTRHQARPRVRHRRTFLHSRLLASSSNGAPLSNLIVKMSLKWVAKEKNIEQTKTMFPFVSCKTSSGQNVSLQIDSVEQPIQSNCVGYWLVSHRWTSSLYIILMTALLSTSVQLRLNSRRMYVSGHIIHHQTKYQPLVFLLSIGVLGSIQLANGGIGNIALNDLLRDVFDRWHQNVASSESHPSALPLLPSCPWPWWFALQSPRSTLHGCFQLFTCVLDGFFEFRILWVGEIDPTQSSNVFKIDLFIGSLLLSPSSWSVFPLISRALAIDDLAWM